MVWTIILAKTAKIILVKGPASATRAISFLPSFKLNGSIGTGFAAPKRIGEPDKRSTRGSKMLIKGSICFLGFKVSLPASLAVGSPNRSATNPCATSCSMAEKIRMIRVIRPEIRPILLKAQSVKLKV